MLVAGVMNTIHAHDPISWVIKWHNSLVKIITLNGLATSLYAKQLTP